MKSDLAEVASNIRPPAATRYRVLFVTPWFPTRDRPFERVFVREHARAVGLTDEVVVLHSMGPDPKMTAAWRMEQELDRALTDGVRTYRIWHRLRAVPGATFVGYVFSIVQAIRRLVAEGFRPDVIHAHIYEAGIPAIVAGKVLGIPVLITEHYSAFPRNLLSWRELLKARTAFALADRVLPVSESLREGIEARGIRARFRVIPNAVNEAFFAGARSRRGRDTEGPIRLLTVGQLKPVKGIPVLLRALALLEQQRTDWRLDVIGDGEELAGYQRLAGDLGIGDKVTFTPSVSKEELAVRMWRAHIFVLASSYETFSVVTAEALASGLPVVATRSGGPAEFIVPGVGILVPPGDAEALSSALHEMLSRYPQYDPEDLSRYARARFSPEVVGRMMHEVYDECAKAAERNPQRRADRRAEWVASIRQRLWLWTAILKQVRGVRLQDIAGLGLSAISDLAACILRHNSDRPPLAKFPLLVALPRWNLRFWVRAGTDDLYHVLPFREEDVHEAIVGCLRLGDIFVDVGANIGYYSLVSAQRVGISGSVVAIEPVEDTARQLRSNVAINAATNVTMVDAAASDDERTSTPISIEGGYFGRATLEGGPESASRRESVRTVTIDTLCQSFASVRLLKIDVEGAEARVLSGARETLRKTDYVVVEANTAIDEIARLLKQHGFAVRRLNFTSHLLAEHR